MKGVVTGSESSRFKRKWFGIIEIRLENNSPISLHSSGLISQWFFEGDVVEVKPLKDSDNLSFGDYELWRIYEGEKVKVWPAFEKEIEIPCFSPISGEKIYSYKLRLREATKKTDFEEIAELEQYHYASHKEVVALWKCDGCGSFIPSNVKPVCSRCGTDENVHIFEIKGSMPSSRFLVLELVSRKEYEPRIVGYVRVDPPVPRMNRRLPNGEIIKDIREKVFPRDWFSPLFHPKQEDSKYFDAIRWKLLKETNTAVTRISRVVIHPDYRSDGLGKVAVEGAVEWIVERRVPEMRRKKELVETIAQMARFNPFFEKVGFRYLWDVGSRRPALYFPLTKEAEKYINRFLSGDKIAKRHGGKLCRSSYGKVEPISGPIIFKDVTKLFESHLNLDGLPKTLRELLEDFGVSMRRIQRRVLSGVNIEIKPREIVVLIGASGAGKTTFLRLLLGRILNAEDERFQVTEGEIYVPSNIKVATLIPGEFEPSFGDESILEHIYKKVGSESMAVEILNRCGLSDAVLYRAKFYELSTGQRERAKLASILAERPNLILVDEFAAHLDTLTAMRVARRFSELIRDSGITLIASTHRAEVIKSLSPSRVIYVGYHTVREHASF